MSASMSESTFTTVMGDGIDVRSGDGVRLEATSELPNLGQQKQCISSSSAQSPRKGLDD